MTITLTKNDTEAILRAYVEEQHPNYTVVTLTPKMAMAGYSQRDDGYTTLAGYDIVLQPKR